MELQNGRPDNTEGRLEKELRVYDLLDRLGVAYQRVDHEAAMTMEACEEIDRVLGDGTAICKNLFLCNRQGFYLRQIQNVIDELQQQFIIPLYNIEILHPFFLRHFRGQNTRKTNYCIERSTYLMTHIG